MKSVMFWIDSVGAQEWEDSWKSKLQNPGFSKTGYKRIMTRPGPTHLWEILKCEAPNRGPFLFNIVYDPENSPYKWTKKFTFLKRIKSNKITRNIIFNIAKIFGKGNVVFPPMHIPFGLLYNFSLDKPSLETTKILNNEAPGIMNPEGDKIKTKYFRWMEENKRKIYQSITLNDVTVIHFEFLDNIRHYLGPDSSESNAAMENVVNVCLEITKKFQRELDLVIFFSDHSMSKIEQYVDVSKFTTKCKELKIPFFVNSPILRCWPGNNKSDVLPLLKELEKQGAGKIIEKQDLSKFNLPVDEKFGEVIFWVSEGVHIYPDFYMEKMKIKGMHGYLKWDPIPFGFWAKKENKKMTKIFKKIKHLNEICSFLKASQQEKMVL